MEHWPEILNTLNIEQTSKFELFDVFLNERDKPRKIEIFEIVKELGSDYSQGYFFSAPIPIPDIFGYNKTMDKNNE